MSIQYNKLYLESENVQTSITQALASFYIRHKHDE